MITYRAAYRFTDDVHLAEVLDFPGTVSCGETLDEARKNLADALLDMAETNLIRGEALPAPDPSRSDPDADLEEPIYLGLQTGNQVHTDINSDVS